HNLEEANGFRYLILELVEGDTLADRVKHGPISLDEALAIAKQIADALEAAHNKGIVHRDLKPANIKITPDGKVKVLDFGLAKVFAESTAADLSNSPTLLSQSQGNVIMGTAAYMSPEQARGWALDRRTDIWAFGCVLYEMLARRQVFPGETVSDTIAGVLARDPDWNAIPADTPPNIRKLLRRCLEKDLKRRLRDIGDARVELEEPEHLETVETATARPATTRYGLLLVAVALIAAAMLTVGLFYSQQTPLQPQFAKLHLVPPDKTTFGALAVSPDGSRIAFTAEDSSAKSRLWVRRLDSVTAQPLPGTDGASYPFWSPDSRFIAFFAENKLKRVDASGGSLQTVCDLIENRGGPRGGSWSRDGVILFAGEPFHPEPFYQVPATGGVPRAVLTQEDSTQVHHHHWPSFLPDGRHFLFFAASNTQREQTGIYVASLDSKDVRMLVKSESAGIYATIPGRSGAEYILFVREGTLVAQRFDSRRLGLTGDTLPVTEQAGVDRSVQRSKFSISGNGILVYAAGGGESQLRWFDRSGKQLGTLGSPGLHIDFAISPDDRTVAAQREDGLGGADIWLLDSTRGTMSRLTFFPTYNLGPVWSADASRITFASIRENSWQLFKKLASGGSDDELVLNKSGTDLVTGGESPDGKFLAFVELNYPKTGGDIWVLPQTVSGQRASPKPLVATEFDENFVRFSPDGKWITYVSSESGRDEIYVRPFQPDGTVGAGKWQISTNGGIEPRWPRHGKEIFYIGPDNMLMSVEVQTGGRFEAGVPRPLFPTRPVGVLRYDVSSDGQRFLVSTPIDEATSAPATVVLNWFAALSR
ncbi:MAG: serine/threonine-protein kinase, partial [Acidobacteria bacterium]|nr:serine/threonine-protein kinase [Acidobacteriota bacterium]